MQDGRISDSRLKASSMYNSYYSPWTARLQDRRGGWRVLRKNQRQWIQIDLETMARMKAIAIQGLYNVNEFVKTFTVSHSTDGSRFYPYKEGGRSKVSENNSVEWC